jgi:hypothetical protein
VSEAQAADLNPSCEVPATPAAVEPLHATEQLFVPNRKRMSHSYLVNEEGVRELHVYYGVKEITFDDPRFFAFGEALATRGSFVAEEATTWGTGYPWAEIAPMLQELIAEGIVRRGQGTDDFRGGGLVPSLLPPSVCPVPRSWSAAECESITQDLGHRPVEVGYLESILSIYRIAHPALDEDERQVGEANVYPPALRLDRETEWRVCQYSGSRYRDEAPMNVTALRAMIKHWKPMMVVLLKVRDYLAKRLPRIQEVWAVGDLHTLSAVVLSLPGYVLMRGGGTSPQRLLHPVLSSLFRITDGIRMTTHEMLFLSAERTRLPHEPLTGAELYAFAERNGILFSETGVCAGPKALIEEFLATACHGVPVQGAEDVVLAPQVEELLERLPEAVEYGLLGLQVWGVTRSIWLPMSKVYKALRSILATAGGPVGERLRQRVEEHWERLHAAKIADDYERDVHWQVYEDCYEQPWHALRAPQGVSRLVDRIAPVAITGEHEAIATQLLALLRVRLATTGLNDAQISSMNDMFIRLLREEQAVLRAATELQEVINTLLERPKPQRALTVRDLRVNYEMYGSSIAKFPYLFDMLGKELEIWIEATATSVRIAERGPL